MNKIFILSLFNEVVRKRNSNLKELLNKSRNTSLDEIAYKNNMIRFDKEYIEDLENLINDIVKKFDEEEHNYKVCKNCKHYIGDPYTSKDGVCNFINSPVPTLTKPNRTCSSFTPKG